ncbi:MAG: zinc-dependent metalloprotease [Nitriliruptoraceae bacterium]|nr:zinc-dependent metalloprotease [Nitriliruptoraceae bacterium]
MIDERAARWAAGFVAPVRRDQPSQVAALRADVARDLPAIDAAARDWTQLGQQLPPTRAQVVGRSGFVTANLEGMRGVFEPMRARLERRRALASRVMGVQLGAVLGLLSIKVLGQFVLPLGGPGGGRLLVVGPNVLDLADEHGPLADDIRRTVVLHEVTHRLQFDGNPWLGDHLRGLMGRYLSAARTDPTELSEIAPRLPEILVEVKRTGDLQPLLQTVLTEEQAEVIGEAQGLMSLLEGHGNATMYEAADTDLITDPQGVREAIAARRGDLASKVLSAVAGMEMKRKQYRDGEAFVRAVVEQAGIPGLNRAFSGPASLPTVDEVGDPQAWLDRVAA